MHGDLRRQLLHANPVQMPRPRFEQVQRAAETADQLELEIRVYSDAEPVHDRRSQHEIRHDRKAATFAAEEQLRECDLLLVPRFTAQTPA
jgi:hypothetical protein